MHTNKRIAGAATAIVFLIAVSFMLYQTPASAVSRTWDGGGTDGTCGGAAGDGNKWSCAANWSGDTLPGASDIAVFDGTSTKNATIDATFAGSLGGMQINSGYTGVITQARSLTVGSSNFSQAAGTFTGATQDITVNGTFSLTAGNFNATTGNLTISGNVTLSGGTFAPSTGTVTLSGGVNPSLDVNSTQEFNNLTFATTAGGNRSLGSGDTLTVDNALVISSSISTGTINALGNVTQNSTAGSGTTIVDFGAAGAQTYTINGGTGPVVRLDSSADASDSITFAAAGGLNGLTITSGFSGTIPISNASNFTMTVNTWNQAAGTFSGSGFSNLTVNILTVSGGTFTSPTTVSTTGINPTFTVPNNQSFTNLSVSVAAGAWINGSANTLVVTNTLTINGGMNNGVISAQGNITQTSSSSSGTTIIDFAAVGAQTYTVNGGGGPVVRLDSSDDASDSITFAAAGSLNGITTTSGFSGTIPISNASNFSITVTTWSQAAGTFNGGAYTLTTTILTVTGGTFNAPTTVSTTGINPTITVPNNQSFTNLTLGVAAGVWINGGANTLVTTGTLAVNTTLSGGTISAQGNITQSSNAGGGTTTIDFSAAGAQTYTMNGGTAPVIRLDEAADASDTISFAAAATIGTLNVTSGFSGTIPITNASNFTMTVNNWTQAAGTFNGGSFSNLNINALTISGGTFNAPTTVTMVGSSPVYNVNVTQTFTNLTVNAPSGVTSVSAGDTLIASGTLTFTSGFNNSGSTGVFEADGNCTVGSSWGGGTGPLKFGGSATQSFNLTGATGVYDGDITINKTGGQVNMASDLVLNAANQDLKIQSGVFNLNGKNLTVNGSTGTTVFQNGGTFQWQGGETLTLNAGNPTIQTGSTVTFTGNGNAGANTYTVTTLATTYYNLSIVSTDGTTDTYQLGANIDINGKFTNSGAFDVSTSNRQMNVAGDWTNTGSFNARAGTVIMDGTSQHVDDTTFFNFTHIASDDTLTFLAGETQTFTGTLDLEGTSGHPLLLRSSVTGTYASIDPQGARIIGYVDVEDSNNVNATAVSCAVTCIDSGHNVNWTLPAPPPPPGRYDYTGAKVILSRLQDPTPTTVDINYTAVNTLAAGSIITITFPAGWTSFVAPTGGSGLGTSPTFGTFANGYTVTCGTGGCASGAITITGGQATTPASPGTYIISITNNANTDVAQVAVAVVDSDQVTLSATVNATLTFDIDTPASGATCTSTGSPYNVPFGTVTTGDVRTSGTTDGVPRICLNVATNAAHGVIVTVKSDNGAMKSTAVPSNTIPSSTAAMSAGTANYGICLVTAASGFTATSPFASTCAIDSNTNSVGGLTANTQTLMTSSGPVASGTSTVSANVAISGITPAHDDYADGLTFVATAKF